MAKWLKNKCHCNQLTRVSSKEVPRNITGDGNLWKNDRQHQNSNSKSWSSKIVFSRHCDNRQLEKAIWPPKLQIVIPITGNTTNSIKILMANLWFTTMTSSKKCWQVTVTVTNKPEIASEIFGKTKISKSLGLWQTVWKFQPQI